MSRKPRPTDVLDDCQKTTEPFAEAEVANSRSVRAAVDARGIPHSLVVSVLAFTKKLFPGSITVESVRDPEIPDDTHIVFRVHASGELPRVLGRQDEWHQQLLAVAKPYIDMFRLSVEMTE